ncbi:hypothetical protein [Streptomyces poonensis]|uniref:Uncharacterized protein n=1 Tax=Streptomyces poonensis TaxID=68255 RepID=A0A918UWY1_9ACTN|nr:hypothetical protein [Streptomyces poonensis]GGZ39150.1 hypothetical protein GCM10010365_69860 [Streptomyces poonensis]GLJ93122.1 hypothetical protein GCM10017589_57340 [Streptomyces poonensis]
MELLTDDVDEYKHMDEYAIDESAMQRDCDMWFAMPPGYVEIPFRDLFSDPDSPEGARVVEAINSLLELVPEEKRDDFLAQLAEARGLTLEMQREGVVHFSIGAHQADDGSMLESVVTLARREIPWTPPKLAAVQAATARKNALPVAVADLPCGPGAFTEALLELPAEADSQRRSLYEATAYLPFPDGRNLAILTLTTTAVNAREHYRDIHRGMAEMVSFDNPLPEEFKAQIPESKVEASTRAVFG